MFFVLRDQFRRPCRLTSCPLISRPTLHTHPPLSIFLACFPVQTLLHIAKEPVLNAFTQCTSFFAEDVLYQNFMLAVAVVMERLPVHGLHLTNTLNLYAGYETGMKKPYFSINALGQCTWGVSASQAGRGEGKLLLRNEHHLTCQNRTRVASGADKGPPTRKGASWCAST